jgi:hypothetical protein
MSYIALVNLFNYQEKSFSPHFRLTWNGTDIDRERLRVGSKHGSRLMVSERTMGPGIVCLARDPPNVWRSLRASPQARLHRPGALHHLMIW